MKEMEAIYRNIKPDRGFPPSLKSTDVSFPFMIYARNYLSKVYEIKGSKAYQFWTFDNWRSADFMAYYRELTDLYISQTKALLEARLIFISHLILLLTS